MDLLLTAEEVAERLKLSRKTIICWLQAGRLAGIKIGNRWRVKVGDLEAFVEPAAPPMTGLEPDTRAWLDSDLSRMEEHEPYDWGDQDPLHGEPVRWDARSNSFVSG